jgi:hypothetical protein
MYCPHCGNEVLEGKRCPACGTPLVAEQPIRAFIILGPDEEPEEKREDPNDLLEDFDRRLP